MSLRKPPPTIVTVLALLTQVLFAVCGPGIALCQEADGRRSIEWTLVDCCVSQPVSEFGSQRAPQALEHRDCAGCEDSLLDAAQRAESPDPGLFPPVPLAVFPVLHSPYLPRMPHGDYRARAGPPLEHLRTVFIRC